MKFVLKNLFLIICGLVVVLALGSWYYLSYYMQPDIQKKMADSLARATKAINLTNQKAIKIGNESFTGPVTPNMIEAKEALQKEVNQQASLIQKAAADANVRDRVKNNVPVLLGQPLPGYLPNIQANVDPHEFKARYTEVLNAWQTQLLFGTMKLPNGTEYKARSLDSWGAPPTEEEIKNAYERDHSNVLADAKAVPGTNALVGGAAGEAVNDVPPYYRNYMDERTRKIKMYVTPGALQRRAFAMATAAPNANQIFEACIDCFVMQDVVRAIMQINGSSKSVMESPIKRLDRIVIGNTADTALGATQGQDPGELFVRMGLPPGTTVDYARAMTGRVGTNEYDVAHVMVTVCVDPSYLNKFINALYQQNNSYTVISCRVEAQDPFEMATSGYFYGRVPVVKADILLESLFFREWTKPIMPKGYRDALSIPDDPPAKR